MDLPETEHDGHDSRQERSPKRPRRNHLLIGAGIAVVVVLGLVIGTVLVRSASDGESTVTELEKRARDLDGVDRTDLHVSTGESDPSRLKVYFDSSAPLATMEDGIAALLHYRDDFDYSDDPDLGSHVDIIVGHGWTDTLMIDLKSLTGPPDLAAAAPLQDVDGVQTVSFVQPRTSVPDDVRAVLYVDDNPLSVAAAVAKTKVAMPILVTTAATNFEGPRGEGLDWYLGDNKPPPTGRNISFDNSAGESRAAVTALAEEFGTGTASIDNALIDPVLTAEVSVLSTDDISTVGQRFTRTIRSSGTLGKEVGVDPFGRVTVRAASGLTVSGMGDRKLAGVDRAVDVGTGVLRASRMPVAVTNGIDQQGRGLRVEMSAATGVGLTAGLDACDGAKAESVRAVGVRRAGARQWSTLTPSLWREYGDALAAFWDGGFPDARISESRDVAVSPVINVVDGSPGADEDPVVRDRVVSALESVPVKASTTISVADHQFVLQSDERMRLAAESDSDEWSDAFIADWNLNHR